MRWYSATGCRNEPRAPFLEEDLALANTALDFIGRARMFYGYAAELAGGGKSETISPFCAITRLRQPADSRAAARRLRLHDDPPAIRRSGVSLYLPRLAESRDERLAAIAAKAKRKPAITCGAAGLTLRFGLGTDESRERAQRAIDDLWGYTHELFDVDPLERELAQPDVDPAALADWHERIGAILGEADLALPNAEWAVRGGRQGYHTENLGHLLNEMQSVHRAHPGAAW